MKMLLATPKITQDSATSALAAKINRMINPSRLGKCLSEEGIHIIGVHLFSPQTSKNCQMRPNNNLYLQYKENLEAAFQELNPDAWKSMVVLAEDQQDVADTQRILSANMHMGPDTQTSPNYFISSGGIIESPYGSLETGLAHLRHIANLNTPGYQKIIEAVKTGFVFMPGMFLGSCINRARASLNKIARENGVLELHIVHNDLLLLK